MVRCPKCSGQMVWVEDQWGWYLCCYQCGRHYRQLVKAVFRRNWLGEEIDGLSNAAVMVRPSS